MADNSWNFSLNASFCSTPKENFMRQLFITVLVLILSVSAQAAQYMDKTEFQALRAYSPGVITQGGKIIWVSGQTALVDANGQDISNDFDAQAKQVFRLIDQILNKANAQLENIVQMTVFLKDSKNGEKLQQIRKDIFQNGNYPASSLITASGFARPGIEIEIQVVAVINDECSKEHLCSH